MLNVKLAGDRAVHLPVDGDVVDGFLFYAVLFPRDSWIRSGTELSQFLRIFLPTIFVTEN